MKSIESFSHSQMKGVRQGREAWHGVTWSCFCFLGSRVADELQTWKCVLTGVKVCYCSPEVDQRRMCIPLSRFKKTQPALAIQSQRPTLTIVFLFLTCSCVKKIQLKIKFLFKLLLLKSRQLLEKNHISYKYTYIRLDQCMSLFPSSELASVQTVHYAVPFFCTSNFNEGL